jgi:tetratricopeptide (TPR) repeat protein
MKTHLNGGWLLAMSFMLLWTAPVLALAANEGQEDLDKATEKKLEAKSLGDLEEVVRLCESAIKKGLDEGGTEFAKQLLASTLMQRGTLLVKPIFDQTPPSPQWPQLRSLALQDLNKAVETDPKQGEAYILIARLQALPRGDADKAKEAIGKAIEAFADKPREKSDAILLRAQMQTEPEKRLADINEALEAFADNEDALRLRGAHFVDQGEHEKGLADMLKVLELKPEDVLAHQAAAEALVSLKKFDDAVTHLDKAIALNDANPGGYILRARLFAIQDKYDKAEEDLNAALKRAPNNLAALLMRSEVRLREKKYDQAEGDVNRVLELRAGLPQAILLRASIYAAQEKYLKAIGDIEQLLAEDPKNADLRMQIAAYYVADKRPSKAIEVYTAILSDDPSYWQALRGRGDALLSISKQVEAIADYEAGLKLKPDSDGLLNNLAWVLATSPDEKLRDGKRSIELATKAVELTQEKAAHILSTLASGYAETGDFETALKWSTKAVETSTEDEEREQLKKEVESYQKKEPWRELQKVEEKPEPEKPRDTDLEL